MQLERFKALKAINEARLSGTSVKRFVDRSRECRVLTTGAKPAAETEVRELSASPKWRRNRHLDDGRTLESRFEELPVR
jgi:hypothetical protein